MKMSETPQYSFYSDVSKLLSIIFTLINLLVLYAICHAISVGPSDGVVALIIIWIIGGACANFFWKRGWPAASSRWRAKAEAQRKEDWEQFKTDEWPKMKADITAWGSRAFADKNGNSFFGTGQPLVKSASDPKGKTASIIDKDEP